MIAALFTLAFILVGACAVVIAWAMHQEASETNRAISTFRHTDSENL